MNSSFPAPGGPPVYHVTRPVVGVIADDVLDLKHLVPNDIAGQLMGQLVKERARLGQQEHERGCRREKVLRSIRYYQCPFLVAKKPHSPVSLIHV